VNGDAIYGTRPWKQFGEGPTEVVEGSFNDTKRQPFTGQDIRFTTRGSTLYAIALAWPGQQLTIRSLGTGSPHAAGEVTGASLLGHPGKLEWSRNGEGLTVKMPGQKPCDYAYTVKIDGLTLR
jgi:alpha-L-fucosidase